MKTRDSVLRLQEETRAVWSFESLTVTFQLSKHMVFIDNSAFNHIREAKNRQPPHHLLASLVLLVCSARATWLPSQLGRGSAVGPHFHCCCLVCCLVKRKENLPNKGQMHRTWHGSLQESQVTEQLLGVYSTPSDASLGFQSKVFPCL